MLQGDENQSHGIYNTNVFCESSVVIKFQRTTYSNFMVQKHSKLPFILLLIKIFANTDSNSTELLEQ